MPCHSTFALTGSCACSRLASCALLVIPVPVSKLLLHFPLPAVQLTEKLNQQLQNTQKELQSFMDEYKIRMKVSQLNL